MDCQKARKIQHRRGMAKRGTSLDPEVGKSSRPLLPASHLHPKKAFEIAENLGILQKKKKVWISKNTVFRKKVEKCLKKLLFFVLQKCSQEHCIKKKNYCITKKRQKGAGRKVRAQNSPWIFLWKCSCFS